MDMRNVVWTAVFAVLFCAVSVIAGLLDAPINLWAPIGMAGIAFAVLAGRS